MSKEGEKEDTSEVGKTRTAVSKKDLEHQERRSFCVPPVTMTLTYYLLTYCVS